MQPICRVIYSSEYHDGIYEYRTTRRIPGNVSYLVENLWEWLRPEGFPSRRRCVCASPAPEHAHAGDQAFNANQSFLTEVILLGKASIAQVPQKDIAYHPDVKLLPRTFLDFFGSEWPELTASHRMDMAPLFLPVIAPEEVEATLQNIKRGPELSEVIRAKSTLWHDARLLKLTDDLFPFAEGEIFFEPFDGYRLKRIR